MSIQNPTMPNDKELRPVLHEEIDRLSDVDLKVLYQVALQLEMDNLTEQLDEEFDSARKQGKIENISELIQAARSEIHSHTE